MRVRHTTESYVALVSDLHKGKYDYSKTHFVSMKGVITVTCKEHGDFYPQAGNHKVTGCPVCFEDRRKYNRAMPKETFLGLLESRSAYTLVSGYVNATTKALFCCKEHGEFSSTPRNLLRYTHNCPTCNGEQSSTRQRLSSRGRVAEALAGLPETITCLSPDPSWSNPEMFNCSIHGDFKSNLDRASQALHVCNECAKEHRSGVVMVSFEEYIEKLHKLYPAPKHRFFLSRAAYERNVGTKLVQGYCEEHGDFTRDRTTLNSGNCSSPCPFCREYGASKPERELISFVRQFADCTQGDRSVIKPKELDCYIPSKSLAIEFCGLYWHSDTKVDRNYHKSKLDECNKAGVSLIHIYNDEWDNKRDICESIIKNRLGLNSTAVYARKLSFQQVDCSEIRSYFDSNHIQGFTPAQRYFVLRDSDGNIKAAASFSKSRLQKDGKWELVRYCSTLGSNVVGGLSKLTKNFMRVESVDRVITYCNLRWFTGKGYKSAGFTQVGVTVPSYKYTNFKECYSRYSTTKKKLAKLLPDFDESLSETSNMEKAGFSKIYDCGHLIFEYTL